MFKKFYLTLTLLFAPLTISAQLFEPPIDNLFLRQTGESGLDFLIGDVKKSSSPSVCVVPPANLVSWYRGEGNANDSQGANNGTLGSSAVFTTGKVGQAFQTTSPNGSTVSIPDSASLDFTNAFTIEMWVSPTQAGTPGGTSFFACKGDCGSFSNQSYSLVFSNTQTVFFRVGNSSTFDSLGTSTILPLNTFSHIAGTYDGNTMRIYINGVLDDSKTTTIGTLANSSQPFIIGGSTGSGNAIGIYDETSLYNRALTDTEIAAIFNAGSEGKCVNLSTLVVTNTNDSGAGSLRSAILASNSTAGTQNIVFDIESVGSNGLGFYNIAPLTPLPSLTDPVIIDATTQPGFSGSPIVEIDGVNLFALANPIGLQVQSNSLIRGLSVINFRSTTSIGIFRGIGISLEEVGANTLEGNYVGVNAQGTAAANHFGLNLASTNNLIGGVSAAERNVVSGNVSGIVVLTANNTVRGNFIGTNAGGTAALGNNMGGITVLTANTTIRDNVVSGNNQSGIRLTTGISNNNLIQNNLIGLNASGTAAIANGAEGILIESQTATGNRLTANRISTNNALGIKLDNRRSGNTGLINDVQDADSGANRLQNYPVLTLASSSGGNTAIVGTLNSAPSQTFTLEFFSSASCDASGNGEGEILLGSSDATTDAGGIVGFTANLPVVVANGRFITATATDAGGNTSEFSRCQIVSPTFEISGRATIGGQPLANARVRLTNTTVPTANRSILTNSNGDYSLGFLPVADYTLTVSHPNHTFTPPSRSYPNLNQNQTAQNFTAVQPTFSLSGKALSGAFTPNIASKTGGADLMPPAPTGNFALRGVTFNLTGAMNATIVNDRFGNYNFNNLPPGNYLVTPSKPNYTFTPPSAAIVIGNGSQIVDFAGESLGLSTLTGRIIYESRDGDIKAMNANGSGIVTLVAPTSRTSVRYSAPNLSPNGRRAVSARQRNSSVSQTGINTINADGSNVVTVLTGEGLSAPVFSPDGSRIAFNNAERRLMVMNADGSNPSPITDNCTEPDWSPDGTKLVCVETLNPNSSDPNSNIATVSADGLIRTIINNTGGRKLSPRWSPDGSRIAFVQQIRIPRNNSLIVMNANGSNAITLLSGTRTIYGTVSWSPDGARLALIRDEGFETLNNAPTANGADRELITVQADGQALLVIEDEFDGNKIDWGVSNSIPTPASTTPTTIQSGSISITFPNVSGTNAITTITPIAPGSAGTAPNTFAYGDFAFEISTTATFSPPVTICINLNTLSRPSAPLMPPASRPRFIHIENGTAVNITTSYNAETNVLCGQTNSFSPFVIAEEIDSNLPQINGLVVDSNGNPLSGVNVDLTGTETRQIQTDSDGIFRFVNLTANGNYNVQPRELGFLFTEYNQDLVNLTGENTMVFTGAANDFQISGRVLNTNGDPISDAIISLDGAEQSDTTTDAGGNYSFTNLPADGNYVLTVSNGANSFAPPQIFVDALTSNIAGADFTQLAPTAASVSIGGQVFDSFSHPISRARISMTDSNGVMRTTVSNTFGYYHFETVAAGQSYVFNVNAKQHQFQPQVFSVNDAVTDLNFMALP